MKDNSISQGRRIDSLQFLRFAGAMCITVYHFSGIWGSLKFDFSRAVYLFYMISGFVVMLSTKKEEKKKYFLTRRLIKVLPLYWGLTLATFTFGQFFPDFIGYKPTALQLVKSLFFIPYMRANAKGSFAIRPIVGLGHTLQLEMLFYLLFLVSMRISHRRRGQIMCGICAAIVCVGMLVPLNNTVLHFYFVNYYTWIAFLAGILVYFLYDLLKDKLGSLKNPAPMIILLLMTAASAAQMFESETPVIFDEGVMLLALITALVYSSMGFKTPKPFIKAGDISFSYYLIHYYTVTLGARFLGVDSFSLRNIAVALAVSAATWGISWISWFIIENKLSGWLNKVICGKAKKTSLTEE